MASVRCPADLEVGGHMAATGGSWGCQDRPGKARTGQARQVNVMSRHLSGDIESDQA